MKTLQAFWHWVDNEKPGTLRALESACDATPLSAHARVALDAAADAVWAVYDDGPAGFSLRWALDNHRDDLRDMSLVIMPVIEAMLDRRTKGNGT